LGEGARGLLRLSAELTGSTRHATAAGMTAPARRWAINGRFLGQPLTGVQRYAREVVGALDQAIDAGHPLAEGLHLELLTPPAVTPDIELSAIRVRAVGPGRGHAWEQAVLPVHARGGLISLCNTGPLLARSQILCLHDVNARLCPETYSPPFRMLHRTLVPLLGRTVARLTTVSRFSADMIARFGIRSRDAVAVVPDGHEHVRRWAPRHTAATRAAAGPSTIVLLGSPARHKNVGLVLGLADQLFAEGLKVAIVGASDPRVFGAAAPRTEHPGLIWLGRLGDDELAALLDDSLCLAFPSLTEGFGLPPLEAMALGCPVIVSDRASLPEIAGEAALFASPEDPEAWLSAFLRLRDHPRERARLAVAGRARAAAFSWAAAADSYLGLMAALDAPALGPSAAPPPSLPATATFDG
jgi:glycosyltransferase involved in cell wall biosynthesis